MLRGPAVLLVIVLSEFMFLLVTSFLTTIIISSFRILGLKPGMSHLQFCYRGEVVLAVFRNHLDGELSYFRLIQTINN